MKKIITLALFVMICSLSVFSQDLLFDGTIADYKTAIIKPEVQAIFESQVFPKARKYFKEQANCDEAFEINDGAAISEFEKVYLYTYCGDGVGETYQGIAIITNGKATNHFVFNTFDLAFSNIFYRNGLIVFYGTGTKFQSDWGTVTAFDWVDKEQHSFMAYDNSCNEMGGNCKLTAQKIYFEFNDGFYFWAEGYQKRNGKWVKTKAKKDVTDDEPNEKVMKDLKILK
jgi:hypothetical protein